MGVRPIVASVRAVNLVTEAQGMVCIPAVCSASLDYFKRPWTDYQMRGIACRQYHRRIVYHIVLVLSNIVQRVLTHC